MLIYNIDVQSQSRTEAMQILNQNMPADFINSDFWPQIRKNLPDVMTEPEDSLTVGHFSYFALKERDQSELYVC